LDGETEDNLVGGFLGREVGRGMDKPISGYSYIYSHTTGRGILSLW